jgi:hypothetical protein
MTCWMCHTHTAGLYAKWFLECNVLYFTISLVFSLSVKILAMELPGRYQGECASLPSPDFHLFTAVKSQPKVQHFSSIDKVKDTTTALISSWKMISGSASKNCRAEDKST